jgi:hypothetical protein
MSFGHSRSGRLTTLIDGDQCSSNAEIKEKLGHGEDQLDVSVPLNVYGYQQRY